MKNIAQFFIQNSKFTVVLTLFTLVIGFMGLSSMNSESFPAVDFAMATIETHYDGASASDVETKITKPIEDEIRTVSGLKDVRSVSKAGHSSIFVRADIDKSDVKEVMADLQKAVDRVTKLPSDLKDRPVYKEINSQEFPVLEIAIIGSNEGRQRDKLADLLKEELEDNKDVLNIRLSGYQKREFFVWLDYNKLEQFHIGIDEVSNKIGLRNTNVPGGNLENNGKQKLLRIEGKIRSKADIENILIRSNHTGNKVYVKDIARVDDGSEEPKVLAHYNGQEATLLIVTKKGGADAITLVDAVKDKVDTFKERYKDDVSLHIYHDESLKVRNKLEVLSSNALSGLILVVVFLFLFLPGRIGFAASMSLPIAVLATMGIMPMFGMNLNAITILALVIALGMLVDNSVVISENFTRLRTEEGLGIQEAALKSVQQLWLPITCTAMTTIAAFLPMLVTTGIMGQFIKAIPIVVTISLVISLIESFFMLPMRLVSFGKTLKVRTANTKSDWFHKFEVKFENFMHILVKKRYIMAVVFSFIIFASGFLMFKVNTFMLFPPEQTEIYVARFEMPKGNSLEKTYEGLEYVTSEIRRVMGEDAKHILGRAGINSVGPNDPKGTNGDYVGLAIIYVSDNFKFNKPSTEVLKMLRTIGSPRFASLNFEAQINGPPVGDPINVTFRSNKLESVDKILEKIVPEMRKEQGVTDLKIQDVLGDNEVYVDIDYIKADQLGLNVTAIGNTVRSAISGKKITDVTLDNKDIDIKLRFEGEYREDKTDLTKVKIMDKLGNLVPLSNVASFREQVGSPQIKRFDFKRSKTLTGNVDNKNITAMVANAKVKELFDKHSAEFPGVSMIFGGEEESTNESMASLAKALVLSLIGIFAILVFLFKSYLRPVIIMSTIPLGLLGTSIAFYLHQRPVSFLAMIGLIGLTGIIVNSGIVLISFIDEMKAEGKLPLEEILAKASRIRLRAVIVTSLTTISGLIPTAYGIGGNDAMLIPMTLAMAWGLTSGTILTLIWVPCAYAILEDFSEFTSNIFKKIFKTNSADSVEKMA